MATKGKINGFQSWEIPTDILLTSKLDIRKREAALFFHFEIIKPPFFIYFGISTQTHLCSTLTQSLDLSRNLDASTEV